MIPDLVAVTCERLGAPKEPCEMLMEILYKMEHHICTQHGDSLSKYSSTLDKVLYGTGQGNSGSLPFWYGTGDVILNRMDRQLKGCRLTCPRGWVKSNRTDDLFVNNSSLIATADNNLNAQERLQENTQRHERYLHCTGGALAAHKFSG